MKSFIKLITKSYLARKCSLSKKRETSSGYTLGIVLIVIALIAMLATEFLSSAVKSIRVSAKNSAADQSALYAESGFRLAEMILDADKKGTTGSLNIKTSADTDSYDDLWARNIPPLDLDGYSIKIIIVDEQSKINVNTIYNEFTDSSQTFPYIILNNFFKDMGFDENYTGCILDYIDKDDSKSQYGAETYDYYSRFSSPGNAKNSYLVSINELLMIKGFSWPLFYGITGGNSGIEGKLVDKNYEQEDLSFDMALSDDSKQTYKEILIAREKSRKLSDYLRVNGKNDDASDDLNKININTAPFRVLIAIPGMTDGFAEEVIEKRKIKPFSSTEKLSSVITDPIIRKNHLTVSSNIFSIKVIVSSPGGDFESFGIYNRNIKKYYYMKTL
ncbi:MAG TPA: type II secretion system protein GspK [Spirochaetota bacterium]|mgnify:FL=1|nr:type II secretion system protein GspK [Spirochaetota bacterium]